MALNMAFQEMEGDIIGMQEVETYGRRGDDNVPANLALEYLLENNPDYAAAAVGDPEYFPSTQPILYRVERFSVLDQGWYFFSYTPDEIYSRTFDGSWAAFASWAHFQEIATGATFRVVNIHTDYSSGSNRMQSAELVANRTAPWVEAGESVIVLGDFNAQSGSPTLEILEDGLGIEFASATGSTFHFNRGFNLFGAIDHIGYVGDLEQVGTTAVVRKKYDGVWPTDHYPVIVDFNVTQV